MDDLASKTGILAQYKLTVEKRGLIKKHERGFVLSYSTIATSIIKIISYGVIQRGMAETSP